MLDLRDTNEVEYAPSNRIPNNPTHDIFNDIATISMTPATTTVSIGDAWGALEVRSCYSMKTVESYTGEKEELDSFNSSMPIVSLELRAIYGTFEDGVRQQRKFEF